MSQNHRDWNLELSYQSLSSLKIGYQIKPAQFETFETETFFILKNMSQNTKFAGQELIPFLDLATFFQFISDTAFTPPSQFQESQTLPPSPPHLMHSADLG